MKRSKTATFGFMLSILMPMLAIAAPLAYRAEILSLRPSMYMVIGALVGAGLGLLLSGIGVIVCRPGSKVGGLAFSVTGVVLSGALLLSLLGPARAARTAPPIHDITTDTQNPPKFIDLLEARKNSPNGPDYDRPRNEGVQRAAYPEIKTLIIEKNPDEVFEDALSLVDPLGWELAGSDKNSGRIEAVESSFWFGFKDDIVIRIQRAKSGGTAVDVRSKSRVGTSDLGVNAARIEEFLSEMAQLQ